MRGRLASYTSLITIRRSQGRSAPPRSSLKNQMAYRFLGSNRTLIESTTNSETERQGNTIQASRRSRIETKKSLEIAREIVPVRLSGPRISCNHALGTCPALITGVLLTFGTHRRSSGSPSAMLEGNRTGTGRPLALR